MKKYLLLILIVFNLNTLKAQEIIEVIKNFNNKILFNENFSQEDYDKIIHNKNFIKKGTVEYENYFTWIKLSIAEIKSRITNKENLIISKYQDLPVNIKEKVGLKINKKYKTLFLLEKDNSKTILITHFIYDKHNKIISFSNKLSKKNLLLNPWYLNEKIVE